MLTYFWIAIGGALGSVARFWLSAVVASRVGLGFPWGTLVVNISGSFLIGLFITVTGTSGRWNPPLGFREFFAVGVCGGYTTFSSFSLQTLVLIENDEWLKATGNIVGSVALCLVAVWLGRYVGLMLNPGKAASL